MLNEKSPTAGSDANPEQADPLVEVQGTTYSQRGAMGKSSDRTPNVFQTMGGKVTVLIVGSALTAGAVFGASSILNAQGEKPPIDTATTSGPETPFVTPSPEQTPAPNPEIEAIPENLIQYKEMSVESFSALPKAEQILYFSWLTKDLDQFIVDWKTQRPDTKDAYTGTSSLDDSPREIVAATDWMKKISVSMKDPNDGQKAMIASLWNGVNSESFAENIDRVNTMGGGSAAALAETGNWQMPFIDSASPLQQNSEGTYFMQIKGTSVQGNPVDGRAYFVNFPGYNGMPFTTWVES